jgi:hypothetical protein
MSSRGDGEVSPFGGLEAESEIQDDAVTDLVHSSLAVAASDANAMEDLDILETQLRRVELQERIQGMRLHLAEAGAKEAELVRLKEENLLKARRLKDEPTAVQMARTLQKGGRTRAEAKEGSRFPGLSSRLEAGGRRGEFYVAATSALEAEPDSRPGERLAKTGLSYGPLKSGRGSAGILEFDARSETGRSHASFGQESRRV